MNCNMVKNSWNKYLSGDISHQEQKAIQEHLRQCDPCQQNLGDIAKWLAKMPQPQFTRSPKKVPRKFFMAASLFIVFAFLYYYFTPAKTENKSTIEILGIESHTVYTSENQQVIYTYRSGEIYED